MFLKLKMYSIYTYNTSLLVVNWFLRLGQSHLLCKRSLDCRIFVWRFCFVSPSIWKCWVSDKMHRHRVDGRSQCRENGLENTSTKLFDTNRHLRMYVYWQNVVKTRCFFYHIFSFCLIPLMLTINLIWLIVNFHERSTTL